jgi:hypothetical protein
MPKLPLFKDEGRIRWALLYEDNQVLVEVGEEDFREALVKAFVMSGEVGKAFDLVKHSLRLKAARS